MIVPNALETIIDFVEGNLDARQFEKAFYADLPDFEQLLDHDYDLPRGHYALPSVYHFIIAQNLNDPGGVLNVHGVLSQYLEHNKISFNPTPIYGDYHSLLIAAQPGYLDLDSRYLAELASTSGGLAGTDLQQWIHAELTERFRYLDAPPVWIQNPEWPINENGPLFFLGQMAVLGYFYDEAAAYVFHDRKNGICETIIQVF